MEVWSKHAVRPVHPGSSADAAGDERHELLGKASTPCRVWPPSTRPRQAAVIAPIEIEDVPFTVRPTLIEGAVGLVSTVPDYLRFCQMLLNKGELDGARLLTAKTVEQMTGNGLPPAILATRGGTMGWGLANVNVQMDPASPLRGEYGWDGTAGTIFWVDPAREMITILMTQSSPADPGRAAPAIQDGQSADSGTP